MGTSGDPRFRLLELLPGEPDDDIRCNLTVESLKDSPTFQALSYAWGSEADLKGIYVNDQVMHVTSNLRSALRHLRRKHESRVLWVDAICIDQKNLEEKSEQIGRMGDFYRASTKTILWIGPASSSSYDALRKCRIMALIEEARRQGLGIVDIQWANHERRIATSCSSPETGPAWNVAIPELLRRSWFSRAWVCQEAILSANAELHCGFFDLDWDVFARGVVYGFGKQLFIFKDVDLNYFSLGAVAGTFIPMSISDSEHSKPADALLHYLMEFRYRIAKEPVDKIYSLLGLVEDAALINVQVNSRLKWQHVYRNVTAQILKHTKHLDVLGAASSDPSSSSSSWTADWRRESIVAEAFRQASGLFANQHRAAGASTSKARLDNDDPDILILSGYPIGHIESTSMILPFPITVTTEKPSAIDTLVIDDNASSKVIIKEMLHAFKDEYSAVAGRWKHLMETFLSWERFAGVDTVSKADIEQRLNGKRPIKEQLVSTITEYWHTLCASHYINGDRTFTEHEFWSWRDSLGLNRALSKFSHGRMSSSKTMALLAGAVKSIGPISRFPEAMSFAVGRRLAKVTISLTGGDSRLALALVPPGAEIGDSIMLCSGGAVPLVTRRKAGNGCDGAWTLLGESYVHGVMQGEAFEEKLCKDLVFR